MVIRPLSRLALLCFAVPLLSITAFILPIVPADAQQPTQAQQEELNRLFQTGIQALNHHDYAAAEQALQAGLDRTTMLNDIYGMSAFLDALGGVYAETGRIDRAIDYETRALAFKEKLGDKADIARELSNLGATYHDAGQMDRSVEYYIKCLSVRQEIGDPTIIAITLADLGSDYTEMGQFERALDLQTRALEMRQKLGNQNDIADSLNNVGNVLYDLGQYAKAEQYYSRTLTIKQSTGDQKGIAFALNNLGNIYLQIGQNDKALQCLTRALEIKQSLGNRADTASGIANVGNAYLSLGQYDKALTLYKQALDMDQALGNKRRIASKLNNIGLVYSTLGQNQKALDYYSRSLSLQEDNGNPQELSGTLENIGHVYVHAGDYKAALDAFQQAAALEEKVGNKRDIAELLDSLGEVFNLLGQNDKALEAFNRALTLKQSIGNKRDIAVSMNNLGNVYKSLGQYDKAVENYSHAVEIKKTLDNRLELAVSETNLALVYNDMGQLDKAQAAFADAVQNNEAITGQIEEASQVGAFQQATLRGLYTRYSALLLRQKHPEDALIMLERGRGQGLARQAGQNRQDFSRLLSPEDAQQLRSALSDFNTASQEWHKAEDLDVLTDADEEAALKQQIIDIRKQYDDAQAHLSQLRSALSAKYPVFQRLQGSKPPTMQELTDLAAHNPDTLYLEWAIGEENTSTLFTLSKQDGLKTFTLPVGLHPLDDKVTAWRQELTDPKESDQKEAALARDLYSTLFSEVEKAGLLAPGRYARLVIVGDSPLLDIPFSALMDAAGKRLIERFPIATAVSLGMLTWPEEEKGSTGSLLCIADPLGGGTAHTSTRLAVAPLPAAREEGRAVASLFPGASILIGDEATKSSVEKVMGNFAVLHFATHGVLDDEDGLRSGLALAPDDVQDSEIDVLEAREIAGMSLTARLAVLSACETAQGQKSGGDGLLGLTWAFRAAGCPSVVASLWSVEDTATDHLMLTFYQDLKAGKRKDEALQDAMLAVKADPERKRPLFWAAFEVVGDTTPLQSASKP